MAATHCQIVMVKPEGNVHAQAFQEVAETLLYALQRMGVPARITTNEVDGAAVNVLLGWHLLGEEALARLPEQTVVYNLEQLDEQNRPMLDRLLALGARFEVWDYSRRNLEILRGSGFPGTLNHAPVGFVEELSRIPKAPVQDIDVLFYGSVNERRLRILDGLRAQGLKVEAVFGVYGAERDALIGRAKVVLNMHYYDSSIFEIVRVSYLLANRKAVVAECHPGTDVDPELREAVRAVPYDGLVEASLGLVHDERARVGLEERGYGIFSALREEAILGGILGGEPDPSEPAPRPAAAPMAAPIPQLTREGGAEPRSDNSYYRGLNQYLLRVVPDSALDVLEVGCAEGRLGAALKELRPGRRVYGIEREAEVAARAADRLDRVYTMDLERDPVGIEAASLDAILFGDVLEHLLDPSSVLKGMAPLLRPEGRIYCCIPNVQHHSVVMPLIRGEFQYQKAGLLDATHLRFFTWASFTRLLLDAGFAPDIRDVISSPIPDVLMEAFRPLLQQLKADGDRSRLTLSAYQWIFEGRPMGSIGKPSRPRKISFVACVNDDVQLSENLAASPCFQGPDPEQLIIVRGASSAADGLAAGLRSAHHEIVILVHQDIYLPEGWVSRFLHQWEMAEARFGEIGVAGVYGATYAEHVPGNTKRFGHVVDRMHLLWEEPDLPAQVASLDEIILAFDRKHGLGLDPSLGFHMYGSDVVMQARDRGLQAVVLDVPCFHNSRSTFTLPEAFHQSAAIFRRKWGRNFPFASSCMVFR